MKRVKGQSILEYVVILTAIIAAIVAFQSTITGSTDGSSGLGQMMSNSADTITSNSSQIATIGTTP